MFSIKLYNSNSTDNTINKKLENEKEFNIVIKDMTTIDNPVIRIKTGDDIAGFNYSYIPVFSRYYFVNDIEIYPNNLYILHLHIDVIESFKDSILKSKALITKATKYNKFWNGGDYNTEITQENTVYKSNVTLPTEQHMILITMGAIK